MSVRVHPFDPQSEYAGVPDSLMVFASLTICDHVFGASRLIAIADRHIIATFRQRDGSFRPDAA